MTKSSDEAAANLAQRTARCRIAVWLLGLTVCVLSIAAWAGDYGWQFPPPSIYVVFPLLGLLAYGLLWSHYVTGTLRGLAGLDRSALRDYFRITGWAVLILICMHPGLLIYQRFRDGFGLPPGSYESYVAPGLGWLTLLGTVSLLVFLAYELYRWFDNRPWWPYVLAAGDLAMLAIFYHGSRLGGQTSHGWFRVVWWFYGLTLAAILIRKYALKYRRHYGG